MRRFETSPVVGMYEPKKLGEGRGLGARLEPEEAEHLFRPGTRARFGQQFPAADARLLLRGFQTLLTGEQIKVGLAAIRDVAQDPDRPGLQVLRIEGLPHDGAPKRRARFTNHARIRGVDFATSKTFIALSAHPFVVCRVCIAARHIDPNHFARRKAEHREVSGIGPLEAAIAQQADTARNRVKNSPVLVRHLPQLLDRLEPLGDVPCLCAECDDVPVGLQNGAQCEIEWPQRSVRQTMRRLEVNHFPTQGPRDRLAQFRLFCLRVRPPGRFPKHPAHEGLHRVADQRTRRLVGVLQNAGAVHDASRMGQLIIGHREERLVGIASAGTGGGGRFGRRLGVGGIIAHGAR